MHTCRLLVVDNEKNLGLLYKEELEDDGYEVEVVNSGKKALQLFDAKSFDLVIMDIFEHGINGIEIMRKMYHGNRTIPVIINTGYPPFNESFMEIEAVGFVVKSFDLSELKRKIRELITPKCLMNH